MNVSVVDVGYLILHFILFCVAVALIAYRLVGRLKQTAEHNNNGRPYEIAIAAMLGILAIVAFIFGCLAGYPTHDLFTRLAYIVLSLLVPTIVFARELQLTSRRRRQNRQ